MELALLSGASLSYRKGLKLLNRLLRRGVESGVKFRTYLDLCQRMGKKAEESAAREAETRLRKHGFDPESGKPRSEEALPPEIRKEAKPEENAEAVARAIEKINAGVRRRTNGSRRRKRKRSLRKIRFIFPLTMWE